MRQNLHTHSKYCDGKNEPREMIENAIEKGFDILGFSGHGYVSFDTASMSIENTSEYIKEIRRLKEEFRDRITIYLGIEEDMENRIMTKEPFDFIIGSCHFLTKDGQVLPIDYSRGVFEYMLDSMFSNDFLTMAETYYRKITRMADWQEVDIIGHLDLIMKFNEDESFIRFDDPAYVRFACDAVDAFAGKKILEVNTGAIARQYRRTPYPAVNLLRYMHEKGVSVCLNSDCHNAEYLDCGFREAMDMIRACGYRSMMKLTPEGFIETDIDEFE